MGPGRRQSQLAIQPSKKRTLGNDYNGDTTAEEATSARNLHKKQRALTTPHSAPKNLDANHAPACSQPPIIPSAGRSIVTATKNKHENEEDFFPDHYERMQQELQKQKEESGTTQTEKERATVFKNTVRRTIFNRIKFILKDSDLDFGGPVYTCMLPALQLVESQHINVEQYWNVHRVLVRRILNDRRGSVCQMMKTAFLSKCKTNVRY